MATSPKGSRNSVKWRLKAREDRRFREGHPWVYSNELQESPKGITPGEWVELLDAKGDFLSFGYGNPQSLIAFRALTRAPESEGDRALREAPDTALAQWLRARLEHAWQLRASVGLAESSFRWIFGEADGLPGVILDLYRMASEKPDADVASVLVAQAHTAGADRLIPEALKQAQVWVQEQWGTLSSLVIRTDIGVRQLEGVPQKPIEVVESPDLRASQKYPGLNLKRFPVALPGGRVLTCDLLEGQKTGLFLDQSANLSRLQSIVTAMRSRSALHGDTRRPLRVLDLCCYVGQWSAAVVQTQGARPLEVTLMDISRAALDLATQNVRAQADKMARALPKIDAMEMDVLSDAMKRFVDAHAGQYDVVIADPPALVKSRKDVGVAKQAYARLNTEALTLLAPGGLLVTCSCSSLMPEDEFAQALAKADRRTLAARKGQTMRWVYRGFQSPDHPILPLFPEGRYLKCWMGFA